MYEWKFVFQCDNQSKRVKDKVSAVFSLLEANWRLEQTRHPEQHMYKASINKA